MPQAVDHITALLEELSERLRDVERRLGTLEAAAAVSKNNVIPTGAGASCNEARAESRDPYSRNKPSGIQAPRPSPPHKLLPALESPSGVFPTLGKAVLGLAGAFLLRAIAESGSAPKLPIMALAIVYAFSWMVWATQPNWLIAGSRTYRRPDRFSSWIYAVTSALILCPLLWEATVRFQVLSATVSSIVLVAFVGTTLALTASRNLRLIPTIATLSSVVTALALIIATRELVPLTAGLLAISCATELSLCFDGALTLRMIPAVAADFGIWLLISILGSDTIPEGYHAVRASTIILLCVLLPVIYAATIMASGFVHLRHVTIFEITQSVIAFVLATYGIMRVTQNQAAFALGVAFLLLALLCYWGTLSRFADEAHTRNRRVSASWAAALLLVGTFLLFPTVFQVPFLCGAAVLTAIVYTRTGKMSLGLHASLYVGAAVAASPMPTYVASAIAGNVPAPPEWRVWTVALAAGLCYAIESRSSNDQGRRRLLWIVPASVVAFTLAAWIISATVRIVSTRAELAASHLSMIRTIVICALALSLGLASRRRHIELGWIAYAAVALGTLKLVFEDLRFGNAASLVVSFLFYGLILILLPRLTKGTAAAS
jgi:hypothetical protein